MGKQVFILEVDSNKNRSWQGTLEWVKGQRKESFRSMLELLRLIDSAVNEGIMEGSTSASETVTIEWGKER